MELSGLGPDDFRRILVEPEANLIVQQTMLLGTEGVEVEVSEEAIDAMAELAATANDRMENIGARRLMTVIERVFEEVSFDAGDRVARGDSKLLVDARFVRDRVEPLLADEDLGRFVL